MKVAVHPGLYDPEETDPILRGTRCGECGATFFPPLGVGCEVCGATPDRLVAMSIRAAGVLHSVATVHLHAGTDIIAPFALAEVQLDDGPLIRVTMAEVVGLEAIGRRVTARWTVLRTDSNGEEVVEPRFVLGAGTEPIGGAS